jgi:hypothetical protein
MFLPTGALLRDGEPPHCGQSAAWPAAGEKAVVDIASNVDGNVAGNMADHAAGAASARSSGSKIVRLIVGIAFMGGTSA